MVARERCFCSTNFSRPAILNFFATAGVETNLYGPFVDTVVKSTWPEGFVADPPLELDLSFSLQALFFFTFDDGGAAAWGYFTADPSS